MEQGEGGRETVSEGKRKRGRERSQVCLHVFNSCGVWCVPNVYLWQLC